MGARQKKKSLFKMLTLGILSNLLLAPSWAAEVTYETDAYSKGETLTAKSLNTKFNNIKSATNGNNDNTNINTSNIGINTNNINVISAQIDANTAKQQVFRVTVGSSNISSTTFSAINGATGTADINGAFCYALQMDGVFVNNIPHNIFLTLRFRPLLSGADIFLPDSVGHMKFMYTDFSRLDAWMNIYCTSAVPPGSYDVELQWRGSTTDPTGWDSQYGYIGLSIW